MLDAALLPADILRAILWADFDRDGSEAPTIGPNGQLTVEAYERERTHRSRAWTMPLVCRSWHSALEGESTRRLFLTDFGALAALTNVADWHHDDLIDYEPRCLVYEADRVMQPSEALLLQGLLALYTKLRTVAIVSMLTKYPDDIDREADYSIVPTLGSVATSCDIQDAFVPVEWLDTVFVKTSLPSRLRLGFLSSSQSSFEVLNRTARASAARLRHLTRLDIALYPLALDDCALSTLLGCLPLLDHLRVRYITSEELPVLFMRKEAIAIPPPDWYHPPAPKQVTFDLLADFDAADLVNLPDSIERLTLISGSFTGRDGYQDVDYIGDSEHEFARALDAGRFPSLVAITSYLIFNEDNPDWHEIEGACARRSITTFILDDIPVRFSFSRSMPKLKGAALIAVCIIFGQRLGCLHLDSVRA